MPIKSLQLSGWFACERIYDHFLSIRELDLDTLKSWIEVDQDTLDWKIALEEAVGIEAVDMLEAVDTLIASDKIRILPEDWELLGWIDRIAVYDVVFPAGRGRHV